MSSHDILLRNLRLFTGESEQAIEQGAVWISGAAVRSAVPA